MRTCMAVLLLPFAFICGCSPGDVSPDGEQGAKSADAKTRMVSLEVPEMHCQFGCWPTVKETLEVEPGVESVTLAAQKKDYEIDARFVHVAVNGEFDAVRAIVSLADAGFADSSVKQP